MKHWPIKITAALVATSMLLAPGSAFAIFGVGDIVFDPTNFVNTLETAVRLLKMVGIAQNQLAMMEANLARLEDLIEMLNDPDLENLKKLEAISENAEGLAYVVDALEASFKNLYPDYTSPVDVKAFEEMQRKWLTQTRESIRKAMAVQGGVTDLKDDRADLESALSKAREADGNLRIGQAAAEINAITAKQLLRLEHMMAVSERARAAQMAEENARERAQTQYHDYLMQGWSERSTATPMSDFP